MSATTVEKKAARKNGLKRAFFTCVAITIEIIFWLLIFNALNDFSFWLNVFTRVYAVVLVLHIYGQNKTSAMKTPWIVLILVVPVFGILMYYMLGLNAHTRKMKQRYKSVDEEIFPLFPKNEGVLEDLKTKDIQAGNIATYISKVAGYPLYNDSDIEYFSSPNEALKSQLEEIKKAEKYIFMEYYSIEDATIWAKVEDALLKKLKEGVEVRVFYDDVGSIPFVNRDFEKKIQQDGISCHLFNPFMPGINAFLNNRDHRKITVIDGRVAYTGGYNLADEYFNITHPFGMWKDTGIKVTGPAVKSFLGIFLENWNAVKDRFKTEDEIQKYMTMDYPYRQKEEGAFIAPYADSPMDNLHVGEDIYLSIINKADRYCYFTTPYLILTDEMISALNNAARRGVDVKIITPAIPDKKVVFSITRSFYPSVVSSGVEIYEWQPGFCHAKMCIADDTMATVGTINLDYRSLYHHFENGCFFCHTKAVEDVKKDFEKILSECENVSEKYKKGKNSSLGIKQLFLRMFAELL